MMATAIASSSAFVSTNPRKRSLAFVRQAASVAPTDFPTPFYADVSLDEPLAQSVEEAPVAAPLNTDQVEAKDATPATDDAAAKKEDTKPAETK